MANVDFYGIDNIINYIKLGGLSKFEVYHIGQDTSSQPLYSNYECNTNEGAVIRFETLCRSLNPNTPYKLIMFDNVKIENKDNGEISVKKQIGKRDKMQATFCINSVFKGEQHERSNSSHIGVTDIAALKTDIIKEINKDREENEVLKAIKQISDRLDYLENEEEEESEVNGSNDQMQQLLGLIGMLKQQANPTLNGVQENTTIDEKTILQNAIKRLYAKNKNLAADLNKLADISEKQPDMFNMLINSLRNL